MIHHLSSMIGPSHTGCSHPTLGWVRAVPCPFYGGLLDRLRDAWALLRGNAYAIRWPVSGELEAALHDLPAPCVQGLMNIWREDRP